MQKPLGHETAGGKPRPVEIVARQAPQHRLRRREPRQDPGQETRRRGAVFFVAAQAAELMEDAALEPAARQSSVDSRNLERQRAAEAG